MIRFKEFLIEELVSKREYRLHVTDPGVKIKNYEMSRRDIRNYKRDKAEIPRKFHKPTYSLTHTRNIDGHTVNVTFENHKGTDNNPVDINYTINNNYLPDDRTPISIHSKIRIMNHVKNVIHSYIHHYKPQEINMTPNTSRKKQTYNIFAKSIAKKFNGINNLDDDERSSVKFKRSRFTF